MSGWLGKMTEASSFNWRVLSYAALIVLAVSISIAVCPADIALFLYLFLLIVFTIALLVYTVFGEGRRNRLTLLSTLATVWIISASIFVYHVQFRTTTTVTWNGMVGIGVDRTRLFTLFSARGIRFRQTASIRQPGKFDGIPCAVLKVSRLECQWYAVCFYTNEDWDRCN